MAPSPAGLADGAVRTSTVSGRAQCSWPAGTPSSPCPHCVGSFPLPHPTHRCGGRGGPLARAGAGPKCPPAPLYGASPLPAPQRRNVAKLGASMHGGILGWAPVQQTTHHLMSLLMGTPLDGGGELARPSGSGRQSEVGSWCRADGTRRLSHSGPVAPCLQASATPAPSFPRCQEAEEPLLSPLPAPLGGEPGARPGEGTCSLVAVTDPDLPTSNPF